MEEPSLEINKELRICAGKYGKKIAYQVNCNHSMINLILIIGVEYRDRSGK